MLQSSSDIVPMSSTSLVVSSSSSITSASVYLLGPPTAEDTGSHRPVFGCVNLAKVVVATHPKNSVMEEHNRLYTESVHRILAWTERKEERIRNLQSFEARLRRDERSYVRRYHHHHQQQQQQQKQHTVRTVKGVKRLYQASNKIIIPSASDGRTYTPKERNNKGIGVSLECCQATPSRQYDSERNHVRSVTGFPSPMKTPLLVRRSLPSSHFTV